MSGLIGRSLIFPCLYLSYDSDNIVVSRSVDTFLRNHIHIRAHKFARRNVIPALCLFLSVLLS